MTHRFTNPLTPLAFCLGMAFATSGHAAPITAQPNIGAAQVVVSADLRKRSKRRTPRQKLEKLLKPHIYYGGRVSRSVREAAGPGTVLLRDERVWGEPAQCSFLTYRGKRAIICESI